MSLLDNKNVLKDGQIYIPSHIWKEIKETYTRVELRDFFSKLVLENNIPYPFFSYTDTELKDEFSRLKKKNIYEEILLVPWKNHRVKYEGDLKHLGQDVFIKHSNIGRMCSNFFTQKERLSTVVNNRRNKSPLEAWSSDKELHRWDILLSYDKVSNWELSNTIRLSAFGYVSQFSSFAARSIYEITQAKNILDFSAGWGDRLVGALASSSAVSYTGIDPNSALHPKYEQIAKFYRHNKKTKFICSPAEDAELEPNQFDLIFTSPPYFDLEVYSNEETQSSSRYDNLESWINNFLFKVMDKCFVWLQEDGRLLLNISDYSDRLICQRMIEYAKSLGFIYEGIIGYNLFLRPILKEKYKDEYLCEPIFAFSKTDKVKPLVLRDSNTLF